MSYKDEWKEYKLNDLANVLNHKRIPLNTRQRKKRQGEYPYYGASGIVDYIDDYLFDGEHVLISEDGENLKSRKTPIAFKANGRFWVNNHAHILKGKSKILNDYIIYYFKNLDITAYVTGAVQPKLNKQNLLSIPIYTPPNKTLNKIVSILSAFDEKIEVNRQMNATLEAMAQAMFREMCLPKDAEKLEDGWEKKSLLDFAKLHSGGTPKTKIKEYWNGNQKWVSGKDVTPNDKSFIIETERTITIEGVNKSRAKLLPKFSTVVTARGTVGKICILSEDMAISQSNYAVSPIDKKSFFFLFRLMDYSINDLQQRSYGTVFDTITTKTLKGLQVIVPPKKILIAFEEKITPLMYKILNNLLENQELAKTRDLLLPKLMSGEIEV